jgi:hypothetical protein
LLAKTYGIRRIVSKEEHILPTAFLILSTPILIFFGAIGYDVYNRRKRARILERNKQRLLQKKKDL